MRKVLKVCLITNIISPYRIPLFNRFSKENNLDLKVIALAEIEANREWQIAKEQIAFDYYVLPGLHKFIWSKEMPIHLNWGLWKALQRYKPDIVITSGYDAPAYWEAFLYAKLFKKKFILWNGTTLLSAGRAGGFIGWMKRIIIKGANRHVSYGSKAAEYLEYMGAPQEDIHIGLNTVNMEWFRKKWLAARAEASFATKTAQYPKVMLLYVGQLIERKNVGRLLKALDKLKEPDVGIFIVGSGPEEVKLKEFCRRRKLDNVYFEGFKQRPSLPKYYALSDILVLPSVEEVWGLVVNEALATGLYILCSKRAGAAYDLIKEGWNGRTFDPYNVEELAKLIQETKENIKEIRERREAISEHACREFSIERSVRAFLDAIYSVTREKR